MTVPMLLSAFAAGLASFLSPCVLPLVPVYIAQLVGPSIWEAQGVAAGVAAGAGAGAAINGRRTANAAMNGRRTANAAMNGRRTANVAINGRRTADVAINGWRTADVAINGRRTADVAINGQRTARLAALKGIYARSVRAPAFQGRERAAIQRLSTVTHALAFVAGFALAFVALGATASALGALLAQQQEALRRIGGVALVLFGLQVAGIIHIPGLERERRYYLRTGTPGYFTSLALGFVFAVGWTPCVGPFLTGVLLLAAQAGTLAAGVLLLAVYALGLGVPFLVVAAGFDRLRPAIKRLSPHLGLIERVAGLLLAALGVAVFFNWLLVINSWFIMRL